MSRLLSLDVILAMCIHNFFPLIWQFNFEISLSYTILCNFFVATLNTNNIAAETKFLNILKHNFYFFKIADLAHVWTVPYN